MDVASPVHLRRRQANENRKARRSYIVRKGRSWRWWQVGAIPKYGDYLEQGFARYYAWYAKAIMLFGMVTSFTLTILC